MNGFNAGMLLPNLVAFSWHAYYYWPRINMKEWEEGYRKMGEESRKKQKKQEEHHGTDK